MQFKNYLKEATLVNHPDRGIEIRPSGGLGSWTIGRLVKNTIDQLEQLAQKVKNEDFEGAEYILFKSGALKAQLSALARYEEFKTKNGKRKIAKGKEIDLGKDISESEMRYQALSMAKELHTALATLTFIEMLSVMDPKNPAKKEVQELETMINQLTTNVGEFIQKYIPDVADADTDDVDELPEEDPEDKIKPKTIPKPKDKAQAAPKDKLKENNANSFKDYLAQAVDEAEGKSMGMGMAIAIKAAYKNAYTAAIKNGADVTTAKAAAKAAASRVQHGAKK